MASSHGTRWVDLRLASVHHLRGRQQVVGDSSHLKKGRRDGTTFFFSFAQARFEAAFVGPTRSRRPIGQSLTK